MLLALQIDPVAFHIGELTVRWYSLFFVAGLWIVWLLMRSLARHMSTPVKVAHVDRAMFWLSIAAVAGGRIGELAFFAPNGLTFPPVSSLSPTAGGMSFHGGLIAVILVLYFFARHHRLPVLALSDIVAAATPAGLCLGRIGNFLNGELYGPETSMPWGIVFPQAGVLPRHPTQLYEAALEGLLLSVVLFRAARWSRALDRPGLVSAAFLAGYGLLRIAVEPLRTDQEPLCSGGCCVTMGQILSSVMLLLGLFLFARLRVRRAADCPSTAKP